jgi:hypothetical protein
MLGWEETLPTAEKRGIPYNLFPLSHHNTDFDFKDKKIYQDTR